MNIDNKQLQLAKYKKAQDLIVTILSMIENKEPCSHILQHNLNAIRMIRSVNKLITNDYIKNCIDSIPGLTSKRKDEIFNEVLNCLK